MPRLCRPLAQLADRHDDPQPRIGALVVALAAHLLYDLNRSRGGAATTKLHDAMGAAMNGEIGNGHRAA